MLIGTIIIVATALIVDAPLQKVLALDRSLLAAIYLGLFPTALATLIYFYLVLKIGAARQFRSTGGWCTAWCDVFARNHRT